MGRKQPPLWRTVIVKPDHQVVLGVRENEPIRGVANHVGAVGNFLKLGEQVRPIFHQPVDSLVPDSPLQKQIGAQPTFSYRYLNQPL
jgi:hypothetical protein